MESPRLDEFSRKELTFLHDTLREKLADFQTKLDRVETWEPSQTKYSLYEFFAEHVDICTQIMTKVDEAQKIVIERDQILYN